MLPESTMRCSLAVFAAVLLLTGCTALVDDVGKHMLSNDLKSLQHDQCIYENDLALFRGCLKHRGGSCTGDTTTPLPHSTQAGGGSTVTPVEPGSSSTLTQSLAMLPAGDPARTAHQVLTHPVTHQAADLHNHLRGHKGSEGSVNSDGNGPNTQCGSQPTHTTHLKIPHVKGFHENLLASIGHSGWEALTNHCSKLLAKSQNVPDLHSLEADCRRAEFIRGYFGAYLRQGEFLRVDLSFKDEIKDLDNKATDIEKALQSIQKQIAPIQAQIPSNSKLSSSIAIKVANQTALLVSSIDAQTRKGYQILVAEDFIDLERDTRNAGALSNSLLQRNSSTTASQLNTALKAIDTDLTTLQAAIGSSTDPKSATGKLAADLTNRAAKVNQNLSNVFKTQSAGFISRDLTFGARLPTLQLAIDPDGDRFKTTLTDVDDNKTLTGKSNFSNLGVVTKDTSGVGTGGNIGAELVRVLFEAIFDAHEGLPALSQTGTQATGLTLEEDYKLPLFKDPTDNISSQDLSHITNINDAVALQTRLIIGRVIEGIGPFSLNNEPIEDLITEIITTSVRKATEKATWCWYACDLDQDIDNIRKDVDKGIKDKVKHDLTDAEGNVTSWAHKEIGHVKVRLEVSQ